MPWCSKVVSGTWWLVRTVISGCTGCSWFEQVEVCEEEFVRDEGFDLAAFWEQQSAEFERSILTGRVTVRLSPAGLRALPHAVERLAADEALAAAGEPDGQGLVTVTLPVESLDVAYHQLLRLGPEAQVLDPPQLRARMAEAATRFVALY